MARVRRSIQVGEEFPLDATIEVEEAAQVPNGRLQERTPRRVSPRQISVGDSFDVYEIHPSESRGRFVAVCGVIMLLIICNLAGAYQWIVTGHFAEFQGMWNITWPVLAPVLIYCFLAKGVGAS
jgi:hypothetical protein